MSEDACMIDIETLSRLPTAAIIEIGACSFDLESPLFGEHVFVSGINPTFYIYTAQPHVYHVEQTTVDWWQETIDRRTLFHNLLKSGTKIRKALQDFVTWFNMSEYTSIWCRSSSFDFAILRHAYGIEFGEDTPWSFRLENDSRTLLGYLDPENALRPDVVLEHSAVDDVQREIIHLQRALQLPRL